MIRDAVVNDAKQIQHLINNFAKQGIMLSVSMNDVYEKMLELIVYEDPQTKEILGVCALHPTWADIAEIRSLAVRPDKHNTRIGSLLVEEQIKRAKKRGFNKVFALTYRQKFFENLGFEVISIDTLPKKMWTDCLKCLKYPDCDEIAMERLI